MKVFLSSFIAAFLVTHVFAQDEEIPDLTEKPKEKPAEEFVEEPEVLVPRLDLDGFETFSLSHFFVIRGGNAATRSDISKLADRVSEQLRIELKEDLPKGSDSTVQIQIHGKLTDAAKKHPFRKQFGVRASGGFYLKLHVHQGGGINAEHLRSALMEIVIFYRALAGKNELTEEFDLVSHPWLVDGLLEMIDWSGRDSARKIYQKLFNKPSLFGVKRLLSVTTKEVAKMDATTRQLYKASAGGLVMALFNHPKGAESMKDMLAEAALFHGEAENLIKRHFPEVNKGKDGVRVAWLLQLAEMSMEPLFDSLSILETEKRIEEVLEFRYLNDAGKEQRVKIEDFEKLFELEEKTRRAAINQVARKLVSLNYKCYPLYRPILYSYGTVLNALSQGSKAQVAKVIQNIAEERKLILQSAVRARDYLDWYMINYASGVTGDYASFSQLEKLYQKKEREASDRRLGAYLDTLEKFYQK